MALTTAEREEFLAEAHVGALSVVESADRAPLAIPIWYQYRPGGDLWIRTGPNSRKARAINDQGRFTMLVQRTTQPLRYVSVEGPVIDTSADTHEQAVEMASRYLPADQVEDFLEFERTQLGEHVVISMRPEHWISADLG